MERSESKREMKMQNFKLVDVVVVLFLIVHLFVFSDFCLFFFLYQLITKL